MAGSWCKNCKFAHVGGLLCFLEPKDARKFEVFCGFVRYNPHQALCGKWESTELMKVAQERHFGKEYAEQNKRAHVCCIQPSTFYHYDLFGLV